MTDYQHLMTVASDMREKSYSPYSHFRVGAALLTKSGKIYTGCNIENASFTPTICAERVAFFKAISEGETDFDCIAIVGGREGEVSDFTAPCGVCRQVMSEWCDPQTFKIIIGSPSSFKAYTLAEVMPFVFTGKEL